MFVSYLQLAIRRILKERMYSVIKIAGLALALSCLFLIYLFVSDELSFDKHNVNPEQLYRIVQLPDIGNEYDPAATTPFPLHDRLLDDYGHVIHKAVRFFNQRAPKVTLNYLEKDIQFNETRFFFADSTVFDVFKVRFVQGDPAQALRQPDGLVMTTEVAQRYFGNEDPIGRILRVEGRFNLVVTGVIEPLPPTSHIQFDILGSFQAINQLYVNGIPTDWEWNICWTYVRVQDGVDQSQLDQSLRDLSTEIRPLREASPIYYASQPITEIRLGSDLVAEIGPTSNRQYITIVLYIGLFILLIASVNFINLSLASSMGRAKEVGVRKVLGASREQLIIQHLCEAIVICLISVAISLLVIIGMLPFFNEVTGKSITVLALMDAEFWGVAVMLIFSITILAGLYPAFVMSSWMPMDLFRSGTPARSSSMTISNLLIVVQFAVSTMLIAGTWTIFRQLDHIKDQRLGFEKDQIIMVPTSFTRLIFFYDSFSDQVTNHASIDYIAGMSAVLGAEFNTFGYQIEGFNQDHTQSIAFYYATHDFAKMFGIPLLAGRFFDRSYGTDQTDAVVVNESFIRLAGWTPEEVLHKEISRDDSRKRIIGVMNDFNFSSLRRQIEPLFLEMPSHIPSQIAYVGIKVRQTDFNSAIYWVEQRWKEIDPTRPFEYFFLDDRLQSQYENESRLAEISGFFSLISIIISCIGLFGLASYSTHRKAKSIGIRKILGASVSSIVLLLSGQFVRLVIVANLISIPLIWWLMNQWLQNFAYRTEVSWIILGITCLITILIAFATVSLQSYKAATRNPVDSLRYE